MLNLQVADHAAEAEALRRLIKLKTKELKHVRALAQEVLLQRSDVEVFLLSSLEQVRLVLRSCCIACCRKLLLFAFITRLLTRLLTAHSRNPRAFCSRYFFGKCCRVQGNGRLRLPVSL